MEGRPGEHVDDGLLATRHATVVLNDGALGGSDVGRGGREERLAHPTSF